MRIAILGLAALFVIAGCGSDDSTATDPVKSGSSTVNFKSDGGGPKPGKAAGGSTSGGASEGFRSGG